LSARGYYAPAASLTACLSMSRRRRRHEDPRAPRKNALPSDEAEARSRFYGTPFQSSVLQTKLQSSGDANSGRVRRSRRASTSSRSVAASLGLTPVIQSDDSFPTAAARTHSPSLGYACNATAVQICSTGKAKGSDAAFRLDDPRRTRNLKVFFKARVLDHVLTEIGELEVPG